MNYRKHGLRALGVSMLAALGLMAFAASGAQASGQVLVLNPEKTALLTGFGNFALSGVGLNLLTNKLLILTLNMEIFCHEAKVATASITETGTGKATIEFKVCLAQGVSGGALTGAVCTIPNITAKTKALIILHSGNTALTEAQHGTGTGAPYILFTPEDLATFATITNNTECALPETAKVKGCLVASVDNLNYAAFHNISSIGTLTLFGCKLLYGANEAHLDAEAKVESVSGELWAVH